MHTPDALRRKALRLEYTLISYNVLEAVIALAAGWRAGSVALVSFGLDSVIEVLAAGILVWRLRDSGSLEEESKKEKKALLLVGLTFFLLAGYVVFEAGSALLGQQAAQTSRIGIALAALVMVWFIVKEGWEAVEEAREGD